MYEIDNQKFGGFVAALRKENGYTQKELAEKLFLSDKAISKWERGLEFYDLRGKDYDDPQWDKLLDQITVDEMVELIGWGRFQTVTINSIGKLATLDTDGPAGVNSFMTGSFGTGYCAGILVAQTWNEDLAYKLAQESVVIHCASIVTMNADFNQKLIDVNVGGTKNVIDICLKHSECKKMVYVSSTGAIPEQPKGTVIRETNQFTPIDKSRQVGCYSQSKALATQMVLDACRECGLKACVVHPSGILGPKDYAVSETTGTVIKIMNGKMPIAMGGSFNLCDVRDLAHGCVKAADKGRIGECYILGNKEVTLKEMCRILHKTSGCKTPYFYVPINMAYKLANRMEKKARKTGEKPMITNFAVYNLARNNQFDYTKAERELEYHTRPYEETLRDEAQWLIAEGFIQN